MLFIWFLIVPHLVILFRFVLDAVVVVVIAVVVVVVAAADTSASNERVSLPPWSNASL